MYDVESVVLNCIISNKYYFFVFTLDIYRLLFVNFINCVVIFLILGLRYQKAFQKPYTSKTNILQYYKKINKIILLKLAIISLYSLGTYFSQLKIYSL